MQLELEELSIPPLEREFKVQKWGFAVVILVIILEIIIFLTSRL